MTDTAGIITFLKACLDEDEQIARAAISPIEPGTWHQGVVPASDPHELYPATDLNSPTRCPEHPPGLPNMCDWSPVIEANADFTRNGPALITHIARWDPARVLAEVEAKREILKEHQPTDTGPVVCSTCADQDWVHVRRSQTGNPEFGGYPCVTVRLLALPYADQPGFDPAWKLTAARCDDCERCTWNPGPDCGHSDHPHCGVCGHCSGRHTGVSNDRWLLTADLA